MPVLEVRSYLGGKWLHLHGEVVERLNPGNLDETVGRIHLADEAGAVEAIDSAQAAFPAWAAKPQKDRIALLRRALDSMAADKSALARIITAENGKTLREAEAEVDAGLADGRYQLDMAAQSALVERPAPVKSGLDAEVRYCPIGVFLLITPWNFPFATVIRKMMPALAFGNTVVSKPSLQTPFAAAFIFQKLHDAGLPPGTANMVVGKSSRTGDAMLTHPAIRGISFTGSTEIGLHISRLKAESDTRLQLELGGKNAQVVLADANLPQAAEAACAAAFSCAGQWCTSTSRVLVEESVFDAFAEDLAARVKQLKPGPGSDPSTTMGAITSESHCRDIADAIAQGRAEGAEVLTGGEIYDEIGGCRGNFIAPTVFAPVSENMTLFTREVFGPVLALTPFKDVDDAIRLANLSPYGLSFSVFTGDKEAAERIIANVHAGICHLNLHTAVRDPAFPVTGWKQSGRGAPECGSFAREFFTHAKAVYYPKVS